MAPLHLPVKPLFVLCVYETMFNFMITYNLHPVLASTSALGGLVLGMIQGYIGKETTQCSTPVSRVAEVRIAGKEAITSYCRQLKFALKNWTLSLP